ncbi:MAG: hypothetical protein ILP22_04945, partial [Oscillospiraceae bacterium]|nr:hypothetical protein [Oscillospiraceae bacterium]
QPAGFSCQGIFGRGAPIILISDIVQTPLSKNQLNLVLKLYLIFLIKSIPIKFFRESALIF